MAKNITVQKIIVAVVAAIFLCCCSCVAYSAIDNQLRQAGILPTHTPKPTSTATATGTPAPSATSTRGPRPTATPTPTPSPTGTPTPGPSPTPTSTHTPEPANCWAAAFVSDVTIPDGTQLEPGEPFTKTWRIRNNGTCTWDGLTLAYSDGADMGQTGAAIPATDPGQAAEINVTLTAPRIPGTYKATFDVTHNEDILLQVTVKIRSGSPTPIPQPTTVPATAAPATAAPQPTAQPQPTSDPSQNGLADGVWYCPGSTAGAAYVGSDQSDKFHVIGCRHANKISAANRICFRDRAAAINYGYIPCGVCRP